MEHNTNKSLTSRESQQLLQEAENHLTSVTHENPAFNIEGRLRLTLLRELFRTFRTYSNSHNSIAGYGGLGLEEMHELAHQIILNKPRDDKDIKIFTYKHIAGSITVSEKPDRH